MKKNIFSVLVLAFGIALQACSPSVEELEFTKGSLDLSRYVAIGDDYTAGYANGGVSHTSQQYAYPNILANQFAQVGGSTEFNQPLFNAGTGTGELQFEGFDSNGVPIINKNLNNRQLRSSAFHYDRCGTIDTLFLYPNYTGPANLHNFGMPGLKPSQLNRAGLGNSNNLNTSNFNPYFERILSAGSDNSYLATVSAANASFYTVWLGMSEIMPNVLSGATCPLNLPSESAIRTSITQLLDSLNKNNAKIALANLPEFKSFAIARTADPIALQNKLRQQQNNPNLEIWIETFTGSVRRIDAKDFLLPEAVYNAGINNYGTDSLNPFVNAQVIDQIEESRISRYITNYNKVITGLATGAQVSFITIDRFKDNTILVDMNSLFLELADRVSYNGTQYNSDMVTGGIFSLDGFSLTPRGQAIVANEFIRSLNLPYDPESSTGGFGANIPRANVNDYPGITYP